MLESLHEDGTLAAVCLYRNLAHQTEYLLNRNWNPPHPPFPPYIHLEKGQLRIFGKRVALVRENLEGDWTNFLLSNSKDSYWHDSKQHVHQCATHCDAL